MTYDESPPRHLGGEPREEIPATEHPGTGGDPLAQGVALLLVSAAWCGVDRLLRVIVEDAVLPAGVLRMTVDADRDPQTADRFSVQTLPELLWVVDGKVHRRLQGAFGRSEVGRFVRDADSGSDRG